MKKLLFIFALLAAAAAHAQQPSPPPFTYVTTPPSGACVGTPPIQIVYFTGAAYVCANGNWAPLGGTGGGGGGSLPTGTGLVKVTGGIGGLATANTDYVTPSYWSTQLGCGILTNVWSPASLQCIPSGGGATTPSTTNLLKGNGLVNGVVPAIPGTDYLPTSAIPATGIILKGSGTVGSAIPAVPSSDYIVPYNVSTDQYIQELWTNFGFFTLRVPSLNHVLYADGFNGYLGIGQAAIAWTNVLANQPMCQVVTYGGNSYIAVLPTNSGVVPGTSFYTWAQVPDSTPGSNVSCAHASAEVYKQQVHANMKVILGAGTYTTNGLVDAITGNAFDDTFSVSLEGCGISCTDLVYNGTAAVPVHTRPIGGAGNSGLSISNMTIDGGGVASAVLEEGSLGNSHFDNLAVGHVAPGANHELEFGFSGGDGFQVFPTNINIGIYPDSGIVNCGTYTANLTGTTITSFTVNTGGGCYQATSSAILTVVLVKGFKGGTSATPCTVMPTGMVATISAPNVTAISAPTGGTGTGCSGTIDVQVYQTQNVGYGLIMNASDSTLKDIICYDGSIACITGGGNVLFLHMHPSVVPVGILVTGGGQFDGTECDAIGNMCFNITEPFAGEGTSITNTSGYVGGGRLLPGSEVYHFANALSAGAPVSIAADSSLCAATPGGTHPPDWQEFGTQAGTINSQADWLSKAPAGLKAMGIDTSCSQAMGDYTPTLTIGTLSVSALTAGTFNPSSVTSPVLYVPPTNTATGSNNYGSTSTNGPQASTWNGSIPITSTGTQQMSAGTGTNPQVLDTFNIYPCPSTCGYVFDDPITLNSTVTAQHFAGTEFPLITVAAGAGAGTSPTIALASAASDLSGYVTVTTGTSPTASATIFTLTFANAYLSPGPKCFAWPANVATHALTGVSGAQFFPANITTTTAALTQGSTALAGATAYEWGYTCTN